MYSIKNINCFFLSIDFESNNSKEIELERVEIKLQSDDSINFGKHQDNPKLFLAKLNFSINMQSDFLKLNAQIGTAIQFESESDNTEIDEVYQYWQSNQEEIITEIKNKINSLLISFFKTTLFETGQ